jgi:hypothetical protein
MSTAKPEGRAMARLPTLGACCLLALTACAAEPEVPLRAAGALEPRADWSNDLPQLLPGIRACLAAGDSRAVGVTKAWPIGSGLTGVRVLQRDGARVDCVAAHAGDHVFLTERVPTASHLPGERDPLFTPAALEPPTSPCLESAAAAEGWLSYDICRDPRPIGRAAGRRPSGRAPALRQEG